MGPAELAERLRPRFPDTLEARGEVSIVVAPAEVVPSLIYLRDQADLAFRFLADLTATDWPDLDPRFWLAYELLSMQERHRVRVKAGLSRDDDPPHVASV